MSGSNPEDLPAEFPSSVVNLVSSKKSEREIAEDLRARVMKVAQPILDLMDEAHKHGFVIGWNQISMDAFGRHTLNGVKIIRPAQEF